MSIAKPMSAVRRAVAYKGQTHGGESPAQRRRTRHKNNKIMGENGSGKITPKRPAVRHTKPAPRVLAPWGMKVRRTRPSKIKWSPAAQRGAMIIDDPVRESEMRNG